MPLFYYEVLDRKGNVTTGKLEGEHMEGVVARLQGMGYIVTEVKEVRSVFPRPRLWSGSRKVSLGELSLFSRQLAAMLGAGIPLTRSLYALKDQVRAPALKRALSEIATDVEAGMSFTDALEDYPHLFSKLFIGLVRAGEVSGTLDEALAHLAEQLQKDKTLRDNIKAVTFYPGMIGIFSFVVMTAMLVFIVPMFVKMFPAGVSLPLPTLIVLSLSDSVRLYWYLWMAIILIAGLLGRRLLKTPQGELRWSQIKFRLPIFGSLVQKATMARFARTLATLLNAGIPVLQALESAGEATGNLLIKNAIKDVREKVEEGRRIAQSLEESNLFPPMVIQMVSVGEETGTLVALLRKIADFFEEEVAIMTKGLSAMLEPLLLVSVGLMVGAMVISLYLPIFTAVTQAGF